MKRNIVIEFDDIFCDVSFALYNTMLKNISSFSYYMKEPTKLMTAQEFNNRNERNVLKYVARDKLNNVDILRLHMIAKKKFFETNYCNSLLPNNFILKLLNKNFLNSKNVEKAYVLIYYSTEESKNTKVKFINKYFKHNKLELIFINLKDKTKELIKTLSAIEWKLLITENTNTIKLVSEDKSFNIEKKEFLLKETGYNEIPLALRKLIELKDCSLTFYKEEY